MKTLHSSSQFFSQCRASKSEVEKQLGPYRKRQSKNKIGQSPEYFVLIKNIRKRHGFWKVSFRILLLRKFSWAFGRNKFWIMKKDINQYHIPYTIFTGAWLSIVRAFAS